MKAMTKGVRKQAVVVTDLHFSLARGARRGALWVPARFSMRAVSSAMDFMDAAGLVDQSGSTVRAVTRRTCPEYGGSTQLSKSFRDNLICHFHADLAIAIGPWPLPD